MTKLHELQSNLLLHTLINKKVHKMKHTVSDGFPYYIERVEGKDYQRLFTSRECFAFFEGINDMKASYRYAPKKWNIKQILGHITDHERIMGYRIFRFSHRDDTPLAGYDHDMFVENSRSNEMCMADLLNDFKCVRANTLSLMSTFSSQQLQLTGSVGKFEATIEDFLKATIGHQDHHVAMIKERYL